MKAQLTRQIKDLPPGTIVRIVQYIDAHALIEHGGKRYLVPVNALKTVPEDTKEDTKNA